MRVRVCIQKLRGLKRLKKADCVCVEARRNQQPVHPSVLQPCSMQRRGEDIHLLIQKIFIASYVCEMLSKNMTKSREVCSLLFRIRQGGLDVFF